MQPDPTRAGARSDLVPTATEDLVARLRRAFLVQQEARWRVAATGAAERIARLARLRDALAARRGELAAAMRADFGKHPAETELSEIQPTLGEISHTMRHLRRWMRPKRTRTPLQLAGARSLVRYEPRGVVLVLAPWNYPVYLTLPPLVAAVAAGNCAFLKPSEKVPLTSAVLREIVEAAFPPDEVAVFLGDRTVAETLLELPFDHVFFTGSGAVGRKVMAAASRHLASVTLELGGKSPVVVDESARIPLAAERIAWGKLLNAGQTCVAPDYALVHASRVEELVARLGRAIERLYGRTPEQRARSGDFPRMIDTAAAARLRGWLDEAVQRGARIELGGEVDVDARYVAPTIVTGVPADAALMREEIFGPVLPIVPFRALDDAIAAIRARPKPLALYVFAERPEAVRRVVEGTSSGGVAVNDVVVQLANSELPFGGVGPSGTGSYHGWWGFRELSHEKAELVQSRYSLTRLLHPPYGLAMKRIVAAAGRLYR